MSHFAQVFLTAALASVLVGGSVSALVGPSQAPGSQGGTSRPQGDGRGGPPPAGSTQGSFDKWWNDPDVRTALKLSDEKAQNLEAIFEKREADIKPYVDFLSRENEKLDRLTRERVADEATYTAQVARVVDLLSRVRESRIVMLYRMYRELQPEQYRKLQEIMDRRNTANRGRGAGSGR